MLIDKSYYNNIYTYLINSVNYLNFHQENLGDF